MKFLALLVLSAALLTSACGSNAAPGGEKVFRYGTPAYGIANENAGMDPHEAYQGWSAIRYGVGETLFKFDDAMQPQPWLAEKYEFINENTVKITLKDNIYFTSGNKMTGAAVKACLEDLISRHNRARVDLKITGITAEGQTVTITSAAKVPVLINYLCDPYGCIIDMSRGTGDDTKISGTGPFMVESLTPKEVVLVKNPAYYGGVPKTDRIIVSSITDGNTLALALQNGEIDAAQGLPYASLPLFKDSAAYKTSSTDTSRTFLAAFNFNTPALQDERVRRAVVMSLDKETFARVQLMGNGIAADGRFRPICPLAAIRCMRPRITRKAHASCLPKQAGRILTATVTWIKTAGRLHCAGLLTASARSCRFWQKPRKAGLKKQASALKLTRRTVMPTFCDAASGIFTPKPLLPHPPVTRSIILPPTC